MNLAKTDFSAPAVLESIEAEMLDRPQVDCPVNHYFGPGIYIREVTFPAGVCALGHAHKKDHLNVVLAGKVMMPEDDGARIIEAPAIFVGKAGRKIGYVMETCVWWNIYATDETDLEKIEDEIVDKSATFQAHAMAENEAAKAFCEADRADFEALGFTTAKHDFASLPPQFQSFITVRTSPIHGKGLFTSNPLGAGQPICPLTLGGKPTTAQQFINHGKHPNCDAQDFGGDTWLMAKRSIDGCMGGSAGEELTLDYRAFSKEAVTCQS